MTRRQTAKPIQNTPNKKNTSPSYHNEISCIIHDTILYNNARLFIDHENSSQKHIHNTQMSVDRKSCIQFVFIFDIGMQTVLQTVSVTVIFKSTWSDWNI